MRKLILILLLPVALWQAGCGDDVSAPDPTPVEISVIPEADTVGTNESVYLRATVEGTADTTVLWSVEGRAYGDTTVGTISPTGRYTAPARVALTSEPLTVGVVATPLAAPSKSDTTLITIEPHEGDLVIDLDPSMTDLGLSETQSFQAGLENAADPGLLWSLDEVPGISDLGSIVDGAYISPDYVEDSLVVIIRATSVQDPSKSAVAFVQICATIEITLQPAAVRIGLGQLATFQVAVRYTADKRVAWYVNGFSGGNTTVGRMVSSDTYQAPNTLPDPAAVLLRAVSQKDTTRQVTADIEIVPPVTAEAEDWIAEQDRGGTAILKVDKILYDASGGYAVEGLDRILEWIEIPVDFQHSGNYNVAFRHATYPNVRVQVTVTDPTQKQSDVSWTLSLISRGCF